MKYENFCHCLCMFYFANVLQFHFCIHFIISALSSTIVRIYLWRAGFSESWKHKFPHENWFWKKKGFFYFVPKEKVLLKLFAAQTATEDSQVQKELFQKLKKEKKRKIKQKIKKKFLLIINTGVPHTCTHVHIHALVQSLTHVHIHIPAMCDTHSHTREREKPHVIRSRLNNIYSNKYRYCNKKNSISST